jgi:hypothetical protein
MKCKAYFHNSSIKGSIPFSFPSLFGYNLCGLRTKKDLMDKARIEIQNQLGYKDIIIDDITILKG